MALLQVSTLPLCSDRCPVLAERKAGGSANMAGRCPLVDPKQIAELCLLRAADVSEAQACVAVRCPLRQTLPQGPETHPSEAQLLLGIHKSACRLPRCFACLSFPSRRPALRLNWEGVLADGAEHGQQLLRDGCPVPVIAMAGEHRVCQVALDCSNLNLPALSDLACTFSGRRREKAGCDAEETRQVGGGTDGGSGYRRKYNGKERGAKLWGTESAAAEGGDGAAEGRWAGGGGRGPADAV